MNYQFSEKIDTNLGNRIGNPRIDIKANLMISEKNENH
jgi:hypothetical protein